MVGAVLAIPRGPSVQAGEPGHVDSAGDSGQGRPSTSPTRLLGGARAVAVWASGETPCASVSPRKEVGLHSLSPQPWVCNVHLPCASGHLEAAPWGDGRACSPRGETLRHWVFLQCAFSQLVVMSDALVFGYLFP